MEKDTFIILAYLSILMALTSKDVFIFGAFILIGCIHLYFFIKMNRDEDKKSI